MPHKIINVERSIVMIDYDKLNYLLYTDDNYLKVSQKLVKTLGVEEAVLYTYLIEKSKKYNPVSIENYFLCTVEDISKDLNFTPFKQRTILNSLSEKQLVKMKFGHARTRYVCVNEDLRVLENLLYESAFSYLEVKLLDYVKNNLEDFKSHAKFTEEESRELQNYFTNMLMDKNIKNHVRRRINIFSLPENDLLVSNQCSSHEHELSHY